MPYLNSLIEDLKNLLSSQNNVFSTKTDILLKIRELLGILQTSSEEKESQNLDQLFKFIGTLNLPDAFAFVKQLNLDTLKEIIIKPRNLGKMLNSLDSLGYENWSLFVEHIGDETLKTIIKTPEDFKIVLDQLNHRNKELRLKLIEILSEEHIDEILEALSKITAAASPADEEKSHRQYPNSLTEILPAQPSDVSSAESDASIFFDALIMLNSVDSLGYKNWILFLGLIGSETLRTIIKTPEDLKIVLDQSDHRNKELRLKLIEILSEEHIDEILEALSKITVAASSVDEEKPHKLNANPITEILSEQPPHFSSAEPDASIFFDALIRKYYIPSENRSDAFRSILLAIPLNCRLQFINTFGDSELLDFLSYENNINNENKKSDNAPGDLTLVFILKALPEESRLAFISQLDEAYLSKMLLSSKKLSSFLIALLEFNISLPQKFLYYFQKRIHNFEDLRSILNCLSLNDSKALIKALNKKKMKSFFKKFFSNKTENQQEKIECFINIFGKDVLSEEDQLLFIDALIADNVLLALTNKPEDVTSILCKIPNANVRDKLHKAFTVLPSGGTRLWNSVVRFRTLVYTVLIFFFLFCTPPGLVIAGLLGVAIPASFSAITLALLGKVSLILLLSPIVFRVVGELLQGVGKGIFEFFLSGILFSPGKLVRLGWEKNSTILRRLGYGFAFFLNPFANFFKYLGIACDMLGKGITQFHWEEAVVSLPVEQQEQQNNPSAESKSASEQKEVTTSFVCPKTLDDYPVSWCEKRRDLAAYKKHVTKAAFTLFAINDNEKAGSYFEMFESEKARLNRIKPPRLS